MKTASAKSGGGSANALPQEMFDAIKQAVEGAFLSGIKMGYPCVDIGVELVDAKYDELTATTFAFEAAASAAFDKACNEASPVMLEPVMNVDIEAPQEFLGEAMSQITQRGGLILGTTVKQDENIINAQAPMAKMFGFSTSLRSVTQGRASFSLTFSHFEVKRS